MPTVFHCRIQNHGRVVIPAVIRSALNLKLGDAVVIDLVDDGVRVRSLAQTLWAVQAVVAAHIPPGVSLADELIVERRGEIQTGPKRSTPRAFLDRVRSAYPDIEPDSGGEEL